MNYLVTGAARGIGRGLTRHLLQQGHRVFLLDANGPELSHTLSLASSWSRKGTFEGQTVDLRDRVLIKDAVGRASAFFDGKLDVLINNAMVTPHIWADDQAMDDGDEEAIMQQWDDRIAVGLTAPFYLSRLCVPLLLQATGSTDGRPGSIINISSTRAYQAEDNHEAYSAAKAGIIGLTRSMSVSLGHKHGIRVNAVIPGWISVDNENEAADKAGTQWKEGMSEADHRWHPAGRVGRVEDVARAVEYLALSDFVTGEEMVVDGGVSRKMYYPE